MSPRRPRDFPTRRFLAVCLLFTGCLLPPPVAVEDTQNARPLVLVEQSKPKQSSIELNLNCGQCEFGLNLDDPDLEDTLYTRWFLLYDRGDTNLFCAADTPPPASQALPRQESTCLLDVQQKFVQPRLTEGSTHTIEVVVSDRPFLEGDPEPFSGNVAPGAQFTVHRWTVLLVRRGTRCDDILNICRDRP